MKTKLILLTMAALIFSGAGAQAQSPANKKKILIAYFSQSGNTRQLAEMIRQGTGGELFAIGPVKPYTSDYNRLTEQAKAEINRGYKPELKTKVADMAKYDIVFLGSPCWWGTVATPVSSFLSGYDFSGKTIIPFMTHGGSRMGHSVADIRKMCPKATVAEGFPVRGSAVKEARKEVEGWLAGLEALK